MKFSVVACLSVVQVTLHVRPSFVSRETTSGTYSSYCSYSRNKEQIRTSCGLPGHKPEVWIVDHGWVSNTNEFCKVKCCNGQGTDGDGLCGCMSEGAKYDTGPYKRLKDWKCCSAALDRTSTMVRLDAAGGPECACSELGAWPRHGALETDCCSKKWNTTAPSKYHCIPHPCAAVGKAPTASLPCCLVTDAGGQHGEKVNTDGGVCGCIPAGRQPWKQNEGTKAHCCSGSLGKDGKCACISNTSQVLLHGAAVTDCCSGAISTSGGKKYCKAKTCTEVGDDAKGGHYCCSGKKGKNDKCACIPPGEKFPTGKGQGVKSCCSGKASGDKCAYLKVGETPSKMTDKTACSSKKVDENGECACVGDGDKVDAADQCCSKAHESGTTCGCLRPDAKLEHGATKKDCCSGIAERNFCLCSPPGYPIRKDNKGKECCAKSQGKYCGCFGPETQVSSEKAAMCCDGGFSYNTTCSCIEAGFAVAPFVHDGACCGKAANKGGVCKQ